jgi:hypothetical protein
MWLANCVSFLPTYQCQLVDSVIARTRRSRRQAEQLYIAGRVVQTHPLIFFNKDYTRVMNCRHRTFIFRNEHNLPRGGATAQRYNPTNPNFAVGL